MQWKWVALLLTLLVIATKCESSVDQSAVLVEDEILDNGPVVKSLHYKHPIFHFLYPDGPSVREILQDEATTWHWHPWKHMPYFVNAQGYVEEEECNVTSSLEDLPDDLFSQEQRLNGAVALHFLAAIYFFTLLAIICNDYFIPTVECICEDLGISEDVAAATFMAVASTTPEFFTNLISTFIAESDMGLGTIIGSMMFNTLGVAACAGLAAVKPVQLSWFPMARDCIIYSINISTLVIIAWDGRIMWYETTVLFVFFILYFALMSQNRRYERVFRNLFEERWRCCKLNSYDIETDGDKAVGAVKSESGFAQPQPMHQRTKKHSMALSFTGSLIDAEIVADEETVKQPKSLWRVSRQSKFKTFWWFYTWPIRFLLTFTVPNPKRMRSWYPLTFVLCILYIGLNSFMIFWMVAIIGYTFGIPESIMGMTLIAWGGCLPEAIISVIMIRQGRGGIGVSQSLGANSLAILMALGLPWFVSTMVKGASYTGAYVEIISTGIEFTIISLLLAVALLFIVFTFTRYRLKKIVGVFLLSIYAVLITFAILVEMDILFPSGRC